MARLPSLLTIETFESVARNKSFTKAADELNVTQSAVSRRVKQLEDSLGSILIARLGSGLSLTSEGQSFLSDISEPLAKIRGVIKTTQQTTDTQVLTIETLPSFAAYWLPETIFSFNRKYPNYQVKVKTSYNLVDFTEETEVDVAIRMAKGIDSKSVKGLHCVKLTDAYTYPVCTPEIAKHVKEPSDINSYTVAVDQAPYNEWGDWSKAAGVDLASCRKYHFNDINLQIQAALAGECVILGRSDLVSKLVSNGSLVQPLPQRVKSQYQFYLVCPKEKLKVERTMDFVLWLTSMGHEEIRLD